MRKIQWRVPPGYVLRRLWRVLRTQLGLAGLLRAAVLASVLTTSLILALAYFSGLPIWSIRVPIWDLLLLSVMFPIFIGFLITIPSLLTFVKIEATKVSVVSGNSQTIIQDHEFQSYSIRESIHGRSILLIRYRKGDNVRRLKTCIPTKVNSKDLKAALASLGPSLNHA